MDEDHFYKQNTKLTGRGVGGLSYVCQRAVDRFLGLVTVLPEQHEADLLLQIRSDETVGYLPIHDLIWSKSLQHRMILHGLNHLVRVK